MRFKGQHFLITGAAGGIGQATAAYLAGQGATLTLWDVHVDNLENIANELNSRSDVVDITNAAAIQETMQDAIRENGALQGVIHCAGILHTGLFETLSLQKQQRIVAVNLTGTVNIAYAAIPHLKPQAGSLVMLASISGFYGAPEFATYAATKAAVINLAQGLRVELDNSGLHICVVCPYFTRTGMIDNNDSAAMFRAIGIKHEPEDIAKSIVKAIERRTFMVRPSFAVWQVFLLTHYLHFSMHRLVSQTWRRGLKKG